MSLDNLCRYVPSNESLDNIDATILSEYEVPSIIIEANRLSCWYNSCRLLLQPTED